MHSRQPGRDLLHPLFLGSVGVLLLNDHVLKGSARVPGWLSGKLSDFAGLFFFPVLVCAAVELLTGRRWIAHRSLVGGTLAAATALGFALVKLWPRANAFIGAVWGPMRLDPTDLLALPSVLASALFIARSERISAPVPLPEPSWTRRGLRFAALALAGLASIATPPPRQVRNYPLWRIETLGSRRIGCANLDAWVSKSGKQGFGVTLDLRPAGAEPCAVEIRSARFHAEGLTSDAAVLPPTMTLAKRMQQYLPFEFDNEALWNRGVREGRLALAVRAGATEEHYELAMRESWDGPHRDGLRDDAATTSPSASSSRAFAEPPSSGPPGGRPPQTMQP